MLLNAGEVLVDDLELIVGGVNRLTNGGFESGESSWRILGNHTRSFVIHGGPSLGRAGAAPDRHRPRRPRGQPHQPVDRQHQRRHGDLPRLGPLAAGQPLPAPAHDAGEVAHHAAAAGVFVRAGHAARPGHARPAQHRVRRQSRPGHSGRAARARPAGRQSAHRRDRPRDRQRRRQVRHAQLPVRRHRHVLHGAHDRRRHRQRQDRRGRHLHRRHSGRRRRHDAGVLSHRLRRPRLDAVSHEAGALGRRARADLPGPRRRRRRQHPGQHVPRLDVRRTWSMPSAPARTSPTS